MYVQATAKDVRDLSLIGFQTPRSPVGSRFMWRKICSLAPVLTLLVVSGCANAQQDQVILECVDDQRKFESKWGNSSIDEWGKVVGTNESNKISLMRVLHDRFYQCGQLLSERPEYQHEMLYLAKVVSDIETKYISKEKGQFLKRTAGRKFCTQRDNSMGSSLPDFFYYPDAMPLKQCVYKLAPGTLPVTVTQTTRDGVLVTANWAHQPGKVLFIYNDNEKEDALADGASLAPGYFVSADKYSYVSITGERSIYALRRIADPLEGNVFYNGY